MSTYENKNRKRICLRNKVQIKKVPFGNSFAFNIQSNYLKAEITKSLLGSLLIFDEGFKAFEQQYPKNPIDGFLDAAFELILRYTYVQHNYLLYAFTFPIDTDINIVNTIGRRCLVMIDKYNISFYIIKMRFSEDMFDGTLFDGILLCDECTFPDYFETTYQPSIQHTNSEIPHHLRKQFNECVQQAISNKQKGQSYKFDSFSGELLPEEEPHRYLVQINIPPKIIEMIVQYTVDKVHEKIEVPTEKQIHIDIPTVLENFKQITQTTDYSTIFKQSPIPPRYIFHIQAVYQLKGDKIAHSIHKLVDEISYKSLLNVKRQLYTDNSSWIQDEWIDPFEMKNSIDTMYYTRHTQINLKNPFHNDYLRYHPQCTPNQEEHTDKHSQYAHFTPTMSPNGEPWDDIYILGKEEVQCILARSKYPYVYTLNSKDPRIRNGEYAKICTLEGRRYIRVILNKIHKQRDKPLKMWCRPIIEKNTNEILGWIPVKYCTQNKH